VQREGGSRRRSTGARRRLEPLHARGRREIDPAAPVAHISYYEADAFARWAGARLPTEAEWEAAASADPTSATSSTGRPGRPRPAAAPCSATSGNGPMSAFCPTPASPPKGAVGEYNGKFMCGQFVLKGASCATPRGHSRAPTAISSPRRALAVHGSAPCSRRLTRSIPPFRADVLAGLAAPIPAIPARWLYDRSGSELFDDDHPAARLLSDPHRDRAARAIMPEIARSPARDCAVVEFGSGLSTKTRSCSRDAPAAYVPSTFRGDYLRDSAAASTSRIPGLPVYPVEADFTRPFELPGGDRRPAQARLLPRLDDRQFRAAQRDRPAAPFPRHARHRREAADRHGPGQAGRAADRAYDDPEGVTAEFNLNLLHRINRELDGDIPVDAFRHQARWNDMLSPDRDAPRRHPRRRFTIAGQALRFRQGSSIHTENSHKYGRAAAACCCSPAAGPRSPNGPTTPAISP
jgi:uncharacterized SAM-dependent methyltransferase